MRFERICLAEWDNYSYQEDYVDIPWPKIHQLTGHNQITWIQSQGRHKCQLIFETNAFGINRLFVEFYDQTARIEYALRFAKY